MIGDVTATNRAGVYALKRKEDLADSSSDDEHEVVFGKVALWGKVIEHAKGYRAQFGYPLELDMRMEAPMPGFPRPAWPERLAGKIRQRYGCVVLTCTSPRRDDAT